MRYVLLVVVGALLFCSNASSTPRNLILFIGDGMGPQQQSLLLLEDDKETHLEELLKKSKISIVQPKSRASLVVDSGCSATQLASGQASLNRTLGLSDKGEPVPTISELAKNQGKSVGLVTDTRVTHATPASFIVHQRSRDDEYKVAENILTAELDLLLGGGIKYFSKREDGRDLLVEAEKKGFNVVRSIDRLRDAEFPVLGLFADSGMHDALAAAHNRQGQEPSLEQMTMLALQRLSDNKDGFFLMVEAGQIDWAGHANDAAWLLAEMERFDRTLGVIMDWMKDRDDTALVVTADHETGSFGFSYSAHEIPPSKVLGTGLFAGTEYNPSYNFQNTSKLELLRGQQYKLLDMVNAAKSLSTVSGKVNKLKLLLARDSRYVYSTLNLEEVFKEVDNKYLTPGHKYLSEKKGAHIHDFTEYYPKIKDNGAAALSRQLAAQQGVVWGTGTHTSTPVFAIFYKVKSPVKNLYSQPELGQLLQEIFIKGPSVTDE